MSSFSNILSSTIFNRVGLDLSDRGWTKLSMDLARLLKAYTSDGNQAKKDLQLALEEVIPSFSGFSDLNN